MKIRHDNLQKKSTELSKNRASDWHIVLLSAIVFILASLTGTAADLADRKQILLVQPIIFCDDDGTHSARHALPRDLINQVFTKPDLEFLDLDPVHWNHGKARRGEINLNTIVKEGHAKGIISTDPRVTTLLFVSAVDGNKGPLGRGLQGGNICFVSLGPEGKMTNPVEQAFVIAHEIGHCLGLRHVVDDPAVPNDVPNLEGDGPFEERIAPEGLHPSQVKTILASSLSQPRRHFHRAAETAKYLAHDHWDNPADNLSENTIRFELSLGQDVELRADPVKRAEFVRKKYRELAAEFTEEEIALLNRLTDRLETLLDGRWPAITRLPWNFAKMDSSFCSSYPHTRGLSIFVTGARLEKFQKDEAHAIQVLLHEKLHIVQRLLPARFEDRFKEYGFERVRLPADSISRLNLIRNPDAPNPIWAIKSDGKPMLLATTLKTIDGKSGMASTLHPLEPAKGKTFTHVPGAAIDEKSVLKKWESRFPVPNGYDDPREVSAYLLMSIFRSDFLETQTPELSPEHQAIIDAERKLLPQTLHLGLQKK